MTTDRPEFTRSDLLLAYEVAIHNDPSVVPHSAVLSALDRWDSARWWARARLRRNARRRLRQRGLTDDACSQAQKIAAGLLPHGREMGDAGPVCMDAVVTWALEWQQAAQHPGAADGA